MTDQITKEIAFLREAARYFENRQTGREDMAFWVNVTNAENCRLIADRLERLEEALRRIFEMDELQIGNPTKNPFDTLEDMNSYWRDTFKAFCAHYQWIAAAALQIGKAHATLGAQARRGIRVGNVPFSEVLTGKPQEAQTPVLGDEVAQKSIQRTDLIPQPQEASGEQDALARAEHLAITHLKADIKSLRAALQAPRAPEGWKLVPMEPTGAQIKAIFAHPVGKKLFLDDHCQEQVVSVDTSIEIYRAMLAASPSPPHAEGNGK